MAAKKLSGAARRKRAKAAREALYGPDIRARGEYVPRPIIGKIETVTDIARELRRVFHEVRSRTLEADLGSKQAFIGTQALKATEVEAELANQALLIAALEARDHLPQMNGHSISYEDATKTELDNSLISETTQ